MTSPSKEMLEGLTLLARREASAVAPSLESLSNHYPSVIPPWEIAGVSPEEYLSNTSDVLNQATHAITTGAPLEISDTLTALTKVLSVASFALKTKEIQKLDSVVYKLYSTLKEKYDNDPTAKTTKIQSSE